VRLSVTDSATNVAFVAHIDLQNRLPGILGLLRFRPATAKPFMGLAELLLRGESPLSRGERELIAAEVSNLNGCQFCYNAHGTHAALQLDGGWDVVDAVVTDLDGAPLSDKLKALLRIAIAVAAGGKRVTPAMIEAAKTVDASDVEIHDVVLIAAAFCMYNRYVDGLATWAPDDRIDYLESGRSIVANGYIA